MIIIHLKYKVGSDKKLNLFFRFLKPPARRVRYLFDYHKILGYDLVKYENYYHEKLG